MDAFFVQLGERVSRVLWLKTKSAYLAGSGTLGTGLDPLTFEMAVPDLGFPLPDFGLPWFGLPDEHSHAPNEWIDLENFQKGIESMAYLYEGLSLK